MDSAQHTRRIPKVKSPSAISLDSPLLRYLCAGSPIASPDRFSSPSPRSSFQRSICSASGSSSRSSRKALSPLSAVENVKMEEDVLVMDGILVPSSESVSPWFKLHKTAKTELCRSWEDFGRCRLSSNCQYAHGKEELRPSLFPVENRAEANTCSNKSYPTRTSPYVPKFHIPCPAMKEALAANHASSPNIPEYTSISPTISIKPETIIPEYFGRASIPTKPIQYDRNPTINIKPGESWVCLSASSSLDDWSPQDDGIQVDLPSQTEKCPSREDVDAHIHCVLYGPTTRKRRPVFDEFSLDN